MSRRKMTKYVKEGMKIAMIESRDLEVGDRIMNTETKQFIPPVKSVSVQGDQQHIVFTDGREVTYTLKKGGRWLIDASEAS